MSTKLPSRARKLRKRLSKLNQMGANVSEAQELEQLRMDLSRLATPLTVQLERVQVLSQGGLVFPDPESLTAFRKKASTVRERFLEAPKAATLKKDKTWRILLDQLGEASSDVETTVSRTWRAYRQTLFAGETPQAVEVKLAKTEANRKALRFYRDLYDDFENTFVKIPSDIDTIERVREMGVKLENAAKAFDFNVPLEVKEFLEAVQSVAGASLDLLTPEVLEWLEEHGSLDAYRVKSSDNR